MSKARSAQAGFACAVHAQLPGLTRNGRPLGRLKAQGTAQNKCIAGVGVSYQEVFAELRRYEHRWVNLATTIAKAGGSGSIKTIARFRCASRTLKAYENEAFAYSVVKGVGYFGDQKKYDNLRCG